MVTATNRKGTATIFPTYKKYIAVATVSFLLRSTRLLYSFEAERIHCQINIHTISTTTATHTSKYYYELKNVHVFQEQPQNRKRLLLLYNSFITNSSISVPKLIIHAALEVTVLMQYAKFHKYIGRD